MATWTGRKLSHTKKHRCFDSFDEGSEFLWIKFQQERFIVLLPFGVFHLHIKLRVLRLY